MFSEWVTKLALGIAVVAACSDVRATVIFNVDSTLDEVDNDVLDGVCLTAAGTCTLRAAMMQANHLNLPVKINLPPGTYAITIPRGDEVGIPMEDSGAFDVQGSADVTIVGTDARTTIIDGNGMDTVFIVGFSDLSGGNLDLNGVTIRGGNGRLGGVLTMYHLAGAIYDLQGTVSLTDCIVRDNVGTPLLLDSGPATITRTLITANQGGGIDGGGNISIADSTIDGNFGFPGIVLFGCGPNSMTSISGSTIANNLAGGLDVTSTNLVIINTTIANNVTTGSGGGIISADGTGTCAVNIYNTTIADNDANTGVGGGIFVESGSFNIYNTLIAGNTNSAINPDDCSGSIFSHANNVFGSTQNCVITKINASQYGLLNSLAYLGPLADNGGPTQTVALLDGSNAIDGGPSVGCFDRNSHIITEDQRGFPRPLGARCDIGAFESGDVVFRNGFE